MPRPTLAATLTLALAVASGCGLSVASTPDEPGAGGKADDGDQSQAPAEATSADSVLLSSEEPIVTLTLAVDPGVSGPVTIRLAPRGTRYSNGEEWEEDFLERYGRGEVSSDECIEGFQVAGAGLSPTAVELCLSPIIGLDRVEKIARPPTVTADAANGEVTLEFYASPAATRAGHEEIWFYAEASW
jgi:hypothetical protein